MEKKHHSFFLFRFRLAALFAVMFIFLSLVTAAGQESIPQLNEKWTGDLDKLVERRMIRVLVVYSKTFYFMDQGRQRGATYELLKEFEKFVNKEFKAKTLKISVMFIPVTRDQLIPWLLEGRGDIAAANLTITPQRRNQIDFSDPLTKGVKELLVSGPDEALLKSLDDLAGKEVHVRYSSSYYESLTELNQSFLQADKPKMNLIASDEAFEDEDLLEMVHAGLIPRIIMDNHKAAFWAQA